MIHEEIINEVSRSEQQDQKLIRNLEYSRLVSYPEDLIMYSVLRLNILIIIPFSSRA